MVDGSAQKCEELICIGDLVQQEASKRPMRGRESFWNFEESFWNFEANF
jgi:hypothetical protein